MHPCLTKNILQDVFCFVYYFFGSAGTEALLSVVGVAGVVSTFLSSDIDILCVSY